MICPQCNSVLLSQVNERETVYWCKGNLPNGAFCHYNKIEDSPEYKFKILSNLKKIEKYFESDEGKSETREWAEALVEKLGLRKRCPTCNRFKSIARGCPNCQ